MKPSPSGSQSFRSLRLSLTEDCNMQCVYCVEEGAVRTRHSATPASVLVERVQRLHQILGLYEVRLTGGEPLLYPHLPELVAGLNQIGIDRISLTSNGLLFNEKIARALHSSGLKDINFSIDAVTDTTLARIARNSGSSRVKKAVSTALDVGIPVKLNCTVLRSWNDHEIVDLLNYALDHDLVIRFLELMKMGPIADQHEEWFYPVEEMVRQIEQHYSVEPSSRGDAATARYYKVHSSERSGRFGTIANHSEPFCSDCDRLRLSADGQLFGCLSYPFGTPIPSDDIDLKNTLTDLLKTKQKSFTGSKLSMKFIGG